MTEILKLEHLSKRFGTFVAVSDFDLSVFEGEFVSLLGPSGCGKTTILRMIAGLERPDAGIIRFEGQDISARPPETRDVSMVFQSYALFPSMTVGENVAFALRIKRKPRADQERAITKYLSLVQLPELRDRYPHQLSGGQRQRVALARALAKQPKILLLDEPLSALDASIRQELRVQIRAIQLTLGITAIYVTHDQEEALSISDRVVVMNGGQIEQQGAPVEIYNSPRTVFVARFVGTSNLFSGVVDDPGLGTMTWREHTLRAFGVARFPRMTQVALALRPEAVRLVRSQDDASAEANRLPVRVGETTFLGAVTRLGLIVAPDFVMHADLTAAAASGWAAGSEGWAVFDSDASTVLEERSPHPIPLEA